MSIPVTLEALHRQIDQRASVVFLLSVGSDGRPHCVQLTVSVEGAGRLLVRRPGRGTLANVAERPLVSLLWPPTEPGGYSLIVDATADGVDGADLPLQPTRAVLHRPAQPADPEGEAHGSDCVKLFSATS